MTRKPRNFEETFPQNSEVRSTKMNAMKSSYQAAGRIPVTSMTQQQKTTECSLRVVWILGKHKKPLSDTEIIKECMTEVMDTCLKANKKRKYSTMYFNFISKWKLHFILVFLLF